MKSSIDNQPKEVALREKFTQLYLQQDITALYKMMSFARDCKRTNASLKLLDVRNAKWVSTIDSATKEKPCFFAFGCAHLPGGNGVISKLLNLGFKVSPVRQRIID